MAFDDQRILERFEEAQDALLVSSGQVSLGSLVERVTNGVIDLEPAFQRRERWTRKQQSALLESFMLNVPIPPIFLAEEPNSPFLVIDGKQRLRAITDFLTGGFALTGLERFVELEHARVSDLPSDIRYALELRMSLDVVTVLRQSDPDWKYEVFYRLNTGGERLTAQEIRNVAFRGFLNDRIMEASESPFLRSQLKIRSTRSPAYARMRDAEFVLRFLAMRNGWTDFGQLQRASLDTYMRQNQRLSAADVDAELSDFSRAIEACERIWGDNAFKRPAEEGWRDQFIAAVYDAEMVAVDSMDDGELEVLKRRRKSVQAATSQLWADEEFYTAVTVATNNKASILYRIESMIGMLKRAAH